MAPTTTQFRQLSTPSGKKAVEMYCAVYENYGEHVFVGAPSIEALAKAWLRITGGAHALNKDEVQHVYVSTADRDATCAPAAANVKCQANGCEEQASFITHGVARCARHRKI